MDTSMEGAVEHLGLGSAQMQQQTQAPAVTFSDPFQGINLEPGLFHNPRQQSAAHIHRQLYPGQNIVPPTPTSMEIHGNHGQYFQNPQDLQQQQQIYDHYKWHQRDQVRSLTRDAVVESLTGSTDQFHSFGFPRRDTS